jgi:hypothetical protein
MPYNWEGDLILQNTVIEKKRYVIGSLNRQIRTDIREWISFEDNIVMKEILKSLVKDGGLPTTKTPGDFDKRAMIVWAFIARSIRYVHDSEKQTKEDFWLFPPEIYTLRQGDCEDGSFLLASLLIASGISPFCVRVVLGEVFDENGASLGGHCWPAYKNEMGTWCILESTLDTIPTRMPVGDKLAEKGQSFQYVPYYCFNNHHLWEIFSEESRNSTAPRLTRYLRLRDRKVHMKKTRLPSGGWLSRITGDWEPGHLEVTEGALKPAGFPGNAIDVAGDASQDPDFYHWSRPCAHAQTDNDDQGRTAESKDQAIANFVAWMKSFTDRLAGASRKNPRHGLFYLGYLLHGVQDLATHQGITNAQHSYLSKLSQGKNDPDHDETNRAKAGEYSRRYLEFLKARHGAAYNRLIGYEGRILPWDRLMTGEKNELLNTGWDLTPGGFVEYVTLAGRYRKVKDTYPVKETLWDADSVFEALIR